VNSVFSTSLSFSMVAVSPRFFQSKIFMVMVDWDVVLVLSPLLEVKDDGEKAPAVDKRAKVTIERLKATIVFYY